MATSGSAPRGAVIVTSDPALFTGAFAPHSKLVRIYDNAAEALAHIERSLPSKVVADLLPTRDGTSGQRLLQQIVARKKPDPSVYLMADSWSGVQKQWTLKLGAAGTLRRDVAEVEALILGTTTAPSKTVQRTIRRVNEHFLRHAGPMGNVQLERLKATTSYDDLEDIQTYINKASALFANEGTRAAFLHSVEHIPGAEGTTATSTVGDPWVHNVNQLFERYAGGFAARVAATHALLQVESNGTFSRPAYAQALSSQLLDPGRAIAFMAALRAAKLDT